MPNKTALLLTLMVISHFAAVTTAAQDRASKPNANERAFQESVGARTSFLVFDEKTIDLRRIEALLSKNIRDDIKGDALARAASFGDVELLHLLIRKGADIHHRTEQGQTVLMLAAAIGFSAQCGNDPLVTSYRGNTEEVKSLLAAGARVNDEDRDGNTALMLAAQNGRSDSVKLLLDAGADVYKTNEHGWTALIYAANSSGNLDEANLKEVVAALIAGGSNLNVRDEQSKTALTYAVRSPAIREMLICAGAIE